MSQFEYVRNRQTYPDVCFAYEGAISSRTAVLDPASSGNVYAVFDTWIAETLGARVVPCVGYVKAEVLAPIIFAEWRQ